MSSEHAPAGTIKHENAMFGKVSDRPRGASVGDLSQRDQIYLHSSPLEQESDKIDGVPSQPRASTLRSLARLVVGGVLLGLDELEQRLPEWERAAARRSADWEPSPTALEDEARNTLPSRLPPGPPASRGHRRVNQVSDRRILLGKAATTLERCERVAWGLTGPVRKPLAHWRIFAPARRRFAELEARGQAKVDRWLERSRAEARRSRALAEIALEETVARSLQELAHNPDIRDLVVEQSTGLASEVVEEVRERSASADAMVERWVRRLLRRQPIPLPEPTPAEDVGASSRSWRGTRG